jgi:hypothetical protein
MGRRRWKLNIDIKRFSLTDYKLMRGSSERSISTDKKLLIKAILMVAATKENL